MPLETSVQGREKVCRTAAKHSPLLSPPAHALCPHVKWQNCSCCCIINQQLRRVDMEFSHLATRLLYLVTQQKKELSGLMRCWSRGGSE